MGAKKLTTFQGEIIYVEDEDEKWHEELARLKRSGRFNVLEAFTDQAPAYGRGAYPHEIIWTSRNRQTIADIQIIEEDVFEKDSYHHHHTFYWAYIWGFELSKKGRNKGRARKLLKECVADLTEWLNEKNQYNPIYHDINKNSIVVQDATEDAIPFWDKMMKEGIITGYAKGNYEREGVWVWDYIEEKHPYLYDDDDDDYNTMITQEAESFSEDEQKACHRCGNTEKDGKLWWVGSRKGFICGGCSDDGKKYRADGENSSLPQAYLMENWEKKHPYEIHVAGCNHGNLVGGDSEHRVFGEASSSIKNVCNEYIDMWTYNFESMPKEWKPSDAEIDAINNMTFSQFMRNKYVKDTVPVKLSPCCKKDVRIKEYCDNALIKDIQTVTPFNAESFNATSKGFDGGFRCGDCDKTYLYHNDAKHGGCEKARRWYDEDVGESCDCMEDAEQSAEYCCMEAESYSAEDKSCECGREGSTKFCEWCRYDKCEKCFQEMKDECRHCEGQDKTPDGKWCEYCDGGEKYICHENNIPEFDWAVMEPEHPYDTTKEEMGYAAESDELEESKKRTKMSMIRTGLAITTFGIVIWNLWTNKKQEKDISDIMDLI